MEYTFKTVNGNNYPKDGEDFLKKLAKPDVTFIIKDSDNKLKVYVEWVKLETLHTSIKLIKLEETTKGRTKKSFEISLSDLLYQLCNNQSSLEILPVSGFDESILYSRNKKYKTL
jgi:hypothetical protein